MNTYQPKTQTVDAGRYTFQITNAADGSATVSVLYLTDDEGTRTVLHISGLAQQSQHDGLLVVAVDPYDAGNSIQVRY